MTTAVKSGQSEGTVEVTPSGIPIYYQSAPKRLYRVGKKTRLKADSPALLGSAQAPDTDWREVPSVTAVLGVLDKPALPWWGMKVGVEGVIVLHNLGLLRSIVPQGSTQQVLACAEPILPGAGLVVAGMEQVVELLKKHQLTVNHVRDKAGDRGQAVHDALEHWAQTGARPDPSVFAPTEQGYVRGLLAFLNDVPSAEPVASEVLVASSEYGFAGRYDLRLRTTEEHDVVVHRTPVKGPQYRRLAPGEYLGDLKTSSGVYPSHARQLEAYEQASIESGYPETEARGILHVGPEGTYEFVRSWATFQDFRAVLDVWQSDQDMKEAKK